MVKNKQTKNKNKTAATMGNFCESWWSAYGLFQAHRYHIGLN